MLIKFLFRTIFFLSAFVLISCEDNYYEDISEITGNQNINAEIVIIGNISSELKYHEVVITKPLLLSEQSIDSISGATVKLTIGNNSYEYIEEINRPNINRLHKRKGVYVSKDSIRGVSGETHTLTVDYLGKTYTASDIMVKANPFDFNSIDLPKLAGGGAYDSLGVLVSPMLNQNTFNFGATEAGLYSWVSIDTVLGYDKSESLTYYFDVIDQQGLLSQIEIGQSATFQLLKDSKVIVKKHSISKQYQDYLIAVLKETYWSNNIFATMPANVPTNVSSGGLGFFYASDVYKKTISATELLELIEENQ